jgi:protoheme IX farnesyltransferase
MPTLIGWAGSAAVIDRDAWFLFAILFLWQFPHFLAIAMMYREDYARAGYHMLPAFDQDARFTRGEILAFTAALVVATLLPVGIHVGFWYSLAVGLAGAFLLYHVLKLAKSATKMLAKGVVHASVLYLPVVLALMIACKR